MRAISGTPLPAKTAHVSRTSGGEILTDDYLNERAISGSKHLRVPRKSRSKKMTVEGGLKHVMFRRLPHIILGCSITGRAITNKLCSLIHVPMDQSGTFFSGSPSSTS